MATTTGISRRTHPRLIARRTNTHVVQALGWTKDDTLFVVLLLAAVVLCATVPLALL